MLDLKKIAVALSAAAVFTYASLLVPGQATTVCGNLGTPIHCSVLAHGFPLSFVADSRATSPTGSVSRDPLSLLIGQDDVLWGRLGLSYSFWLLTVLIGESAWRRGQRQRSSN